jgi:rSAM/selenodomain-associated transferase 1
MAGTDRTEAVVIAAKYPKRGAVKTRLARNIGAGMALRLYLGFIRDLDTKLGTRDRPLYWAYTPPGCDFSALVDSPCFPQEGADLGESMLNIFGKMFRRGYERVCVIGADSPHLTTGRIDEAFQFLSRADCVFSPTEDGGYNLVGLKTACDLFTGIAMSTPNTLSDTLERAKALGLSCRLLPLSFDVDNISDLEHLRRLPDPVGDYLQHTRIVMRQFFKA